MAGDAFNLTRDRGHPVYLQILAQIERRIASGSLAQGAPLPSVRALARQLRVNPNTVVRAYRELEFRGLVESRHGEGTFVSRAARSDATALIEERAESYVREAKELGLGRDDAVAAVRAAWRRSTKASNVA